MKVTQEYSEPESITDRRPYRVRIEGKGGQAIEIIEMMGGGFKISGVRALGMNVLTIAPMCHDAIVVEVK